MSIFVNTGSVLVLRLAFNILKILHKICCFDDTTTKLVKEVTLHKKIEIQFLAVIWKTGTSLLYLSNFWWNVQEKGFALGYLLRIQ